MKPTIIGTGVPKDAKIIAGNNGKRYVAFTVEHHDQRLQYPVRVSCVTSSQDPDRTAREIEAARLIQYVGEADAEAYESKQTGKPLGKLKVWVNRWDALDYGPKSAPAGEANQKANPFKKPQPAVPAEAAKAADGADLEVPF